LRSWSISRAVALKASTLNSFQGCLEQRRMTGRRFPPPVGRKNARCFIVRDNGGQQLAYVYFEDEPGRRSAAKLPSLSPSFDLWTGEATRGCASWD